MASTIPYIGISGNDTAYNALITYVIPESPASEVGLKRGEWIMQINDDYITKKTEKLLTEGENQKLLLGKYVSAVNDEGEDESKIESYRDVVLPAARPLEDVAIPGLRRLLQWKYKCRLLGIQQLQ